MIKNRIKELRENSKLTQKELALLVGKDHTTVNKHENHLLPVPKEAVVLYAKVFKIETFELFYDSASID